MNGGKNVIAEIPEPVILREKLSRKILRSTMAQFPSLTVALLELVDNAFDGFDGINGGNFLDINIVITKNSIIVENTGGKGMGPDELNQWLDWGGNQKIDAIGEYGQGGKAAMGYMGKAWIVQTKLWNEPWLWELNEDNWDDISSKEKVYSVVPKRDENKKRTNLGYCKFEIRKLKPRRQDKKRIKEELSNIYRRYLEEGKVKITINYDETVSPLILPIYEGYKVSDIKQKTSHGLYINGWIGRLKRDVRVKGGPRISGGMRLLRKGRLICEGEYFGHPDFRSKASLGTLIGEVELSSKVPVLPDKTGFDIDSPVWAEVNDVMHRVLEPHIKELQSQKEEETISREERKRVSEVRNMMIEALKLLDKYSEFSGKLIEDKGRKRPELKSEKNESINIQDSKEEKNEEIPQKREPRTPPPESPVGRLKRLGKMPDWELRQLGPDIRSIWDDKQNHRYLVINKDYCLYTAREGDELYIAETAALQLAKPGDDDNFILGNYLNEINSLMRAFCEVYEATH
jgi:hypothetical protein